ncbi:Glycoside hydrolase [Flavobacterium sp. 9AF]|uniref:glycosyl hydrolase family 18 protein n=1 Tax=Flavobacterium sp. 9AF TaxID=2653142 RepID=UPI0012F2E3BB|nr:glycosyl hydrolase family 18 protein [Flavobacterium sp. 9AF]VXB31167.1 Glycoside hydrolase [Flavobacterium sp. 9AF]
MLKTTLTLLKQKGAYLFLLISTFMTAQTNRVVGYVPDYRLYAVNQIDFTKITHVNYSFGNPDASGNLVVTDITPLKNAIASSNPSIQILLSIGGGAVNVTHWNAVLASSSSRATFITQLVNYTVTNAIAGIDVDLEWDFASNTNYSPFVLELKSALQAENKLMTAALPGGTLFSVITPQALAAFDFVNIMAYDYTGPWQPGSPGQHSSYAHAQSAISFWKSHVTASKLNLGVPFYSHSFVNATTTGPDRSFGEIVAANSAYADVDQIGTDPNNYNEYYNGRPTIANKVTLAHNEGLGGMMIWELGQDAFNQYSLLTTIANTMATLETPAFDAVAYHVSPNPTQDWVTLSLSNNQPIERVEIYDFLGKIIRVVADNKDTRCRINLSDCEKGMYFAKVRSESNETLIKIIKQ